MPQPPPGPKSTGSALAEVAGGLGMATAGGLVAAAGGAAVETGVGAAAAAGGVALATHGISQLSRGWHSLFNGGRHEPARIIGPAPGSASPAAKPGSAGQEASSTGIGRPTSPTVDPGMTVESSRDRARKSLEKQIAAHEEKLKNYKANPDAYDNKGFLKNAPSDEIRQDIIDGRVKHLEHEIEEFRKQRDAAAEEGDGN
jgi:hypothetical protein